MKRLNSSGKKNTGIKGRMFLFKVLLYFKTTDEQVFLTNNFFFHLELKSNCRGRIMPTTMHYKGKGTKLRTFGIVSFAPYRKVLMAPTELYHYAGLFKMQSDK